MEEKKYVIFPKWKQLGPVVLPALVANRSSEWMFGKEKRQPNDLTAVASSSFTSNTVYSLVICSRS